MADQTIPGFSERLSWFLEVDRRTGHVSFCYASRTGVHGAILRNINSRLQTIKSARGKQKAELLADLIEYVAENNAEDAAISEEWRNHLDSKKRTLESAA